MITWSGSLPNKMDHTVRLLEDDDRDLWSWG